MGSSMKDLCSGCANLCMAHACAAEAALHDDDFSAACVLLLLLHAAAVLHAAAAPITPHSVLCRDEAQKLWAERAALEAVGLKVVCVVHEWIDREVRRSTGEGCDRCLSV